MNTNLIFNKAKYIAGDNVIIYTNKDKYKVVLQRECEILDNSLYSLKTTENENIYCFSDLKKGSYIISIGPYQGAFSIDEKEDKTVLYGFLSDFEKPSNGKEIESLCRLHINTVQFYDWMFRHDDLISKEKEYLDPLNRKINLDVIRDKVKRCCQSGMRPFAYGAIYAATEKVFSKHPQWGLYTIDGKPLKFADWLYYMDISREKGWSNYITEEFIKAIKEIGFKGIHMDTYGFPKTGCNFEGDNVFLGEEIPYLMEKVEKAVKKEGEDNGIIFNAVNDWPTETVSKCSDAAYIEVWPPHNSYFDLFLLIKKAKLLGHDNVVLACYIEPFRNENQINAENAWRLTFATINASGGTQLVMGEDKALLSNSYYADYSKLRESFVSISVRYFDFSVAYKKLLYKDTGVNVSFTACGGINEDIIFSSQAVKFSSNGDGDKVWTIISETKNRINCQLINLTSNNNLWNKGKENSTLVEDILLKIRLNRKIKNIWTASPDFEDIRPFKLNFDYAIIEQGRLYSVKVPKLQFWTMVVIDME
ncbi:MAG: glycoside hydrolase family 66 protein [Sphaerochaetaceae bacterium]